LKLTDDWHELMLAQPSVVKDNGHLLNPSLTRYLLFLNSATHISVNFAASVHILITKQPVLSPPPSYTPSLTTATHFTTIYLILN